MANFDASMDRVRALGRQQREAMDEEASWRSRFDAAARVKDPVCGMVLNRADAFAKEIAERGPTISVWRNATSVS